MCCFKNYNSLTHTTNHEFSHGKQWSIKNRRKNDYQYKNSELEADIYGTINTAENKQLCTCWKTPGQNKILTKNNVKKNGADSGHIHPLDEYRFWVAQLTHAKYQALLHHFRLLFANAKKLLKEAEEFCE